MFFKLNGQFWCKGVIPEKGIDSLKLVKFMQLVEILLEFVQNAPLMFL